ncbi:hypothetical protein GCM10029992_27370 [Glycomyces albus]
MRESMEHMDETLMAGERDTDRGEFVGQRMPVVHRRITESAARHPLSDRRRILPTRRPPRLHAKALSRGVHLSRPPGLTLEEPKASSFGGVWDDLDRAALSPEESADLIAKRSPWIPIRGELSLAGPIPELCAILALVSDNGINDVEPLFSTPYPRGDIK